MNTNITSKLALPRHAFATLLLCAAAVAFSPASANAAAQIFVTNYDAGTVGAYNSDGSVVNASLITVPGAFENPYGIAVTDTNIFVAYSGSGKVRKYNLDGTVVNASLITGLDKPTGVAISGGYLFVANRGSGTVGKYNLDGTVVNASLVTTGLLGGLSGIAANDTNFFVSSDTGFKGIGAYNLDGTVVNASLINVGFNPAGMAISGGNLFVANQNDFVGEYTTTGTTVNDRLISGQPGVPLGIAVSGTRLFLTNAGTNKVSEFDTSGNSVNESFITGLGGPYGIAVVNPVPEPSACAMLAAATASLLGFRRRRR